MIKIDNDFLAYAFRGIKKREFTIEERILSKALFPIRIITKTISGAFPLSWQDGIGGDLVDYSLTGKTELSGQKNQLVQNGNFESTSLWSLKGEKVKSFTVSNNKAQIVFKEYGYGIAIYVSSYNMFNNILGHKYAVFVTVSDINANQIDVDDSYMGQFSIRYITANGDYGTIYTATTNGPTQFTIRCGQSNEDDSVSISNCMVVDLTALVGAGNEPTTTAEAKALIARVMNHGTPLDYYPYDAGTPYSIGVGDYGGKKNQLVVNGNFSTVGNWYFVGDAAVPRPTVNNNIATVNYVDGIVYDFSRLETSDLIDIVIGHKYLFTYSIKLSKNGGRISPRIGGNTFDRVENYPINDWILCDSIATIDDVSDKTLRIYVLLNGWGYGDYMQFKNLQIFDLTAMFPTDTPTDVSTAKSRIAEVMGGQQEYYPYDSGTDYYKVPMVVTSGACVDLGTLNWGKDIQGYFQAIAPTDIKHYGVREVSNMYERLHTTVALYYINDNTGKKIGVYYDRNYSNPYIRCSDEDYSDSASFKSAMSGVYLYYQRETDESWYIQNKTIYRTTQLTANQTIRKSTDNLPNFTDLPTGYLQMGVDTEVAPSGGSVSYQSRSVSV